MTKMQHQKARELISVTYCLTGITVNAKDLKYSNNDISGNISEVKAVEKSGFQLKHLQTKFVYDSTHAELAALDLQTNNSHISKYIYVGYPSLEMIKDSLAIMKVKLKLSNSVVALNDILYFQPNLIDQLKLKKIKLCYPH